MRRDHFRPLSDIESGHARGNNEGRNLCATVGSRARAGKDCVEISDACVGNEAFAAVNYVAVVIDLRGSLQRRDV